MFNFLKNIFGGTQSSPSKKSCCGGCCGEKKSFDLGISDADRVVLQTVADTVVVGKILAIASHPDTSVTKVRVTKCDLGNGLTEQILCGGANIAEGQMVPIATIGTDLGSGFIISERNIRGELSRGMICARQEIGLTEVEAEKGGIWIMPAALESKLGTPVNQL